MPPFPTLSKAKHQSLLKKSLDDAAKAMAFMQLPSSQHFILKAAALLAETLARGNKILIAGNGGSLCDAQHFAEELTGQFRKARPALPAIALSDPSHLTCVGNDMGFDRIFARGVEALGKKGDAFIALSTSGNSENIYQALLQARQQELHTLAFLGKEGGKCLNNSDMEWVVKGFGSSDRVQEAHMAAMHMIIELIEDHLFYGEK